MDLSIARKHIEMLYLDRCDIIEFQEVEEDNITRMVELVVQSDIPCKISHERISQTGEGMAPSVDLSSKLIISPDIELRAGSKINVHRNGKVTHYECSSEPAMFNNHQEIWLTLIGGFA